MDKKKETFTGWNWFILIASGLFALMFLVDGLLANPYSLFWFLMFLIGFISIINKYKRAKERKA